MCTRFIETGIHIIMFTKHGTVISFYKGVWYLFHYKHVHRYKHMFKRFVSLLTGSRMFLHKYVSHVWLIYGVWFFFHTKYTNITHYSGTEHIDIPKLNTSTVVHNYHADHNLAKNRYLLSFFFIYFYMVIH